MGQLCLLSWQICVGQVNLLTVTSRLVLFFLTQLSTIQSIYVFCNYSIHLSVPLFSVSVSILNLLLFYSTVFVFLSYTLFMYTCRHNNTHCSIHFLTVSQLLSE
jgi:hypothetical protein